MNVPIIKLEVEGMKYAICTALTEYAAQMDTYIQEAVESFCTEGNLRKVVTAAANVALEQTIKTEVDKFFRHGAGSVAVAEAVRESILAKNTYTPLDDV